MGYWEGLGHSAFWDFETQKNNVLWESTVCVFPGPLEDAEASLTLKGSGHTLSAPDEKNHSFLLDTHTHTHTHMHVYRRLPRSKSRCPLWQADE